MDRWPRGLRRRLAKPLNLATPGSVGSNPTLSAINIKIKGSVAERLKALVLKTSEPGDPRFHGFKSHRFRQLLKMQGTKSMDSEQRKLSLLLVENGSNLMDLKFFKGSSNDKFSNDEIRREFCSALEQKKSGSANISSSFNDITKKVDIRALLVSVL